jgi:glycosyltransferase involved in cell wall biosynthesis
MVQDREAALHMGQHGREHAEQKFSWRRVAEQYAELFASS